MRLRTEGTENHCVRRALRMYCPILCGRRFTPLGVRCSSAPAPSVLKMSKVDRSKCSGECCDARSDWEMPKYFHAHSRKRRTLRCETITPLGTPVEPEVKRMCARSVSLLSDSTGVAGRAARAAPLDARGGAALPGGAGAHPPRGGGRAGVGRAQGPPRE